MASVMVTAGPSRVHPKQWEINSEPSASSGRMLVSTPAVLVCVSMTCAGPQLGT
jgi:hypothetical protein